MRSPLVLVLIGCCTVVHATETVDSTQEPHDVVRTTVEHAALWALTPEQWTRYETYMAQTGKYFYKHLDPVFVSGLIAESDAERLKLADLYNQQEYARVQQLVAFQTTAAIAFKQRYGDEPVMSLDKLYALVNQPHPQRAAQAPPPSPTFGDRIALFIDNTCRRACDRAFRRHYNVVRNRQGISLDIYFVGKTTDDAIQNWARRLKIDPKLVLTRVITLNHDDRHALFGAPRVPAAFLVRQNAVVGQL